MKKAKRLVSLLLAVVMLLSLAIPAGAAVNPDPTPTEPTTTIDMEGNLPEAGETAGKITVKDAIYGEDYYLYQLLYLESFTPSTTTTVDGVTQTIEGTYSYKVTNAWRSFFTSSDIAMYFTVDPAGYATWTLPGYTGTNVVEFTQKAIKYAKENGIKPVKIQKLEADATHEAGTKGEFSFTDLKLGYYLIDTTVGSLCTLNTAAPVIEVKDKNGIPTTDKKVNEGSEWLQENDVIIGKDFLYRSIINFKSGVEEIIYHDKMGEGLTFKGINEIILDADSADQAKAKAAKLTNADYSVITECDDGCTFHITFTQKFYDDMLKNTGDHTLTVKYWGELNEKAYVGKISIDDADLLTSGKAKNINEHHLTYGEKNHSTTKYKTVTKTYDAPVFKNYLATVNGAQVKKGLDDTHFVLSNDILPADTSVDEWVNDPNFTKYTFIKEASETDSNNLTWDIYRLATLEEMADTTKASTLITEIVTSESGRFKIRGLDTGTYYLYETQAHDGYNKLTGPVTMVIRADGKIYKNETEAKDGYIDIENSSGSLLPATGGIGTTIFYVAGSILLIGAAILLIVKKRMGEEK